MTRPTRVVAALLLCLCGLPALGQNQQQLPDSPKPQADRPSFPTPNPTVPSRPVPSPNDSTPTQQLPPSVAEDAGGQPTAAPDQPNQSSTQPEIRTVQQGRATSGDTPSREQLFTLTKEVNFVFVPVTVKDGSGRLVAGLTMQNFSIYENDQKQRIMYFTSDPFPISAAVVLDVGMADVALKRVAETFGALSGAFSQFDEVSIYSYGNTVKQQQDFVGALSDKVSLALRKSGEIQGRGSGPMVADSPLTAGPSVNGRPFDPSTPNPVTRTRSDEPSRVLNDAILRAALDLSKRDRTRRKVIFVISDGREQGSTASYADVLKVLLSNEVSVYAIAVDAAAIPGYNKLNKIRLPRQGYSNILPKYASATGGEVFTEFTQRAIEQAYAGVTEQARNQYTIGYTSPTSVAAPGTYRSIEVRVSRPGLKVVARDGYYPLPTSRRQAGGAD